MKSGYLLTTTKTTRNTTRKYSNRLYSSRSTMFNAVEAFSDLQTHCRLECDVRDEMPDFHQNLFRLVNRKTNKVEYTFTVESVDVNQPV